MSAEATGAVAALNERFLLDFPHEAAREIEAMPAEDAAEVLAAAPARAVVRAWQALAPDVAREVLERLPPTLAAHLLGEAPPPRPRRWRSSVRKSAAACSARLSPRWRASWVSFCSIPRTRPAA
jgi:hypothetical protein